MADSSKDSMRLGTLLLLVAGTGALVAVAIFVLQQMQPVVLRGVAIDNRIRNARTQLTLRTREAPDAHLAKVHPDKRGCFEIPLDDIHAPGELMLHARRGRHRAVVSPVGPRAATDFAIRMGRINDRAQLTIEQADSATLKEHAHCFGKRP